MCKQNRNATNRTLALYLERILLEYTDAKHDIYLSLSDIQGHLRTAFGIKVDECQPRQVLKEMAEAGYLSPKENKSDKSSCLVPTCRVRMIPAPKRGNAALYAIERECEPGHIKHLIRHLQEMDKTKGTREVEDLLLRNANEVDREEIRDELVQSSLLATEPQDRVELKQLIRRIDILDTAIAKKIKVRFRYTKARKLKPGELGEYTPYLVSPSEGFYYLFVKADGKSPAKKGKLFDAIRVDWIDDLELTDTPVDDPDIFEKRAEQARRVCRAGIGRIFSEQIDQVLVACINPKKEKYLRDAIRDKDGYCKGQKTAEGHREYQFLASHDAMIPWALKWYDAFKVLGPEELRIEIEAKVKNFANNSVYCAK